MAPGSVDHVGTWSLPRAQFLLPRQGSRYFFFYQWRLTDGETLAILRFPWLKSGSHVGATSKPSLRPKASAWSQTAKWGFLSTRSPLPIMGFLPRALVRVSRNREVDWRAPLSIGIWDGSRPNELIVAV